ncbi:Rib/alpha-like domain-containing protein, partial [Corynebacterium propinquum]
MNHNVPANKPVRRKGVTIAAAALSVALVAPFAQSVAYPEITAAAQAQENPVPSREVKTIEKNPPTFYANSFAFNLETGNRGRTAGPRTVRMTGILALPDEEQFKDIHTFFPKGTTFEPRRLDWEFTSDGWYGVSRENESETEELRGSTSEMISAAGAPGANRKRWPYIVPHTGQVLFGLEKRAEGTTESVPMRARWTDPATGKNYIWHFEQNIEVGIGRAPESPAPNDGEVLIKNHSQEEILKKLIKPTPEINRSSGKLGAFVFGRAFDDEDGKATLAGSNFGRYLGPRGSLGETARKEAEKDGKSFYEEIGRSEETYRRPELPNAQTNLYGFKYEVVKGKDHSEQPQFHVEGKPEELVTFKTGNSGSRSPRPVGAKFSFNGELPDGAKDATIDPDTGVVTLANPVNAQVSIPVKVIYGDGTEDKSTVEFIPADKKLNDTVEPSYTKPGEGKLESEAPIFHSQDDAVSVVSKPENTRFELGENAPTDLQVEVDPQSGVVTVKLGEGESLQTPVEVPVKVVYSDDSVDTATIEFTPARTADKLTPSYKPLTVEQGQDTTLEAPTFDKVETPDVTESDPAPAGTTFKAGDLSKLPEDLSATVKDDGSVELTVGEGVQTREYKVPVTVTYEDGSEDTAEVSVTVEAKVKDPEPPATAPVADDLGYLQDIHVAPDNYKRSDSTGTPDLPDTIQKQDGDFFRFGELPEGFVRNPNPSWNGVEEIIREGAGESERVLLRINKQNGKVEVNAGPDADYSLQELPVEYADANGNLKGKDTVSVSVRPIAHSWNGEPTESENGSVNVPYTGSKPDLTKDLTPSVTKGDGEAMLDENGNINYTPGEGDRPGDEIEVAITDSEDDHVRDVVFKIPSQSDDYTPEGADVSVFRGQDADEVAGEGVSNKGELPEGTTFAFKGDVDTSTVGTLPEAQTLVVTYPDGSTDEVEVNVHVVDGTEHGWDTDSPVKGNDGDVTVSYTGEGADALGDDAGVEVSNGDGVASLDEDGNVVYTPGAGDKPGDVVQVEVFDGDGDSVGVVEFAIPSFAEQRDPEGQSISVAEGGELDPADAITNKGELPEG